MTIFKAGVMFLLAAVNTATVILGLWYTTASIAAHAKLPVFGVEIPAFLVGFAVVYIGVRSFIKLFRLFKQIMDPGVKFSWQNFKGGI